jgi:hypothetical protein
MTAPPKTYPPVVDHDDLTMLATIIAGAAVGALVLAWLAFMVGLAVRIFLFASGL